MPSLSEYDKMAKEVAQFLTGHDDKIVKEVQDKMKAAAGNLEFEKAQNTEMSCNPFPPCGPSNV